MNLNEIETGDILLSSSRSLIARMIQFFQKVKNKESGKFNHAMIAYRDENNNIFVIEAEKKEYNKLIL